MRIRERLRHLRKITRWGWFVIYELGWITLFTNADLIIGKYGSERAKATWDRLTHPHWGWRVWLIGALLIAILSLWEGSYRNHKETEERYQKEVRGLRAELASLKEEAPEIYLEYSPSQAAQFLNFSGLSVRNDGKRTGFKICVDCTIDPMVGIRMVFEDMPIQAVNPGKGEPVRVRTEYFNSNGMWYPIGGVLGGQVSGCFERVDLAEVPVTITYLDHSKREHRTPCFIRCQKSAIGNPRRIWCDLT